MNRFPGHCCALISVICLALSGDVVLGSDLG